jgi:hypothetical protein
VSQKTRLRKKDEALAPEQIHEGLTRQALLAVGRLQATTGPLSGSPALPPRMLVVCTSWWMRHFRGCLQVCIFFWQLQAVS